LAKQAGLNLLGDLTAALGLELPFIFDAGKILCHTGDTGSNLINRILLVTKRMGYGYSMAKHPVLIEL
jgi:adenosine deaminase CECR1